MISSVEVLALVRRMDLLIERVARLNPDAGEIGPGMLRFLVEEARAIQAEARAQLEEIKR